MQGFLAIYKREVKTYFQSPSTYVVLALFFLIVGAIFQDLMRGFSMASAASMGGGMFGQQQEAPNVTEAVIRNIFQILVSLVMFTVPMLSMRLVAEEKSSGTFELLATCPVGDWAILLGKYFALVTVGVFIAALSAVFPLVVAWAGVENKVQPEWPVVITCWIALILIFATYAAFGVMASSFTENQITACVLTLIGLIIWNILSGFQMDDRPFLRDVLSELSAQGHTENFINGVLLLKDIVFYFFASFLFLFIASKTLDSRRWRV